MLRCCMAETYINAVDRCSVGSNNGVRVAVLADA